MSESSLPTPHDRVGNDLEALLRTAAIEVIPLRGAEDKIGSVHRDTTLTITCSPKFGLTRTLDHVAAARTAGYRVVPHLAARMIGSTSELHEFVSRLGDLGVDDLYVIGGDGSAPLGPLAEAQDVLQALQDIDHPFVRLGVGCYPEGHPQIGTEVLTDALVRKQDHASYMVSQLCFDSSALLSWIRGIRGSGVHLPLRIGIAAPLQARKRMELALKIGVGSSVKFLTKQHGMVGNLLLGRAYDPGELLADVLAASDLDDLNIEGLHLFSFNQIDLTVDWLARNLPR